MTSKQRIGQIYLVFENCDGCTIPSNLIERLNISGGTKTLYSDHDAEIGYHYSAKSLWIQFKEEAKKLVIESGFINPGTLIERLEKYRDICQIIIYDERGIMMHHYHIEWGDDDNQHENPKQQIEQLIGCWTLQTA